LSHADWFLATLDSCLRQNKISTEIFIKCGFFLAQKKHHPNTTLLPAIHHNFTTKNHHGTTRFLKNPLKKRPSTTHKKSRT
jgi:hypothetical protein